MTNSEPPIAERHRAGFRTSLRHGLFLVLEKWLRWCIDPRLRARLLGLLGAQIGKNVRVYEIQLFNLEQGFRNLMLANDVHIGPGCRLDLAGKLMIGPRSTLSSGVTLLTHSDPGASHGSRLVERYPPRIDGVSIGGDCWLGANVTVLAGVHIYDLSVVAAGGVVVEDVPPGSLVAGVPARPKELRSRTANR